jgi:hypothetical protein
VLTASNADWTDGFNCLPKDGGVRDTTFWSPLRTLLTYAINAARTDRVAIELFQIRKCKMEHENPLNEIWSIAIALITRLKKNFKFSSNGELK